MIYLIILFYISYKNSIIWIIPWNNCCRRCITIAFITASKYVSYRSRYWILSLIFLGFWKYIILNSKTNFTILINSILSITLSFWYAHILLEQITCFAVYAKSSYVFTSLAIFWTNLAYCRWRIIFLWVMHYIITWSTNTLFINLLI